MPPLETLDKHLAGKHDQKTHGSGGGFREVQAASNEQAWAAVLTDEARMIDDRMRAFPERYNPWGRPGYGLKDGQIETRVVRQDGPPRVRDYETSTSAGFTTMDVSGVEGSLNMAQSGYGKPLVPVGEARPPQHVYRVMSEGEWQQARERGYMQSDQRMNLSLDEGTVTSLRSTGSFYVPVDGSDYRVVRIKYADEDGWRTDPVDGYIKTDARIPFDRVDMATTPVSQSTVVKHGDHSDPDHDLGISRRDMPQVDLPSLRALLSRRGVRAQRRRMNPSDLRRTQDGLNPEKVQEIARGAKPLGVIVVSRDGHILDGHHRWAAAMERGIKVDSLVVDLGIKDLLALVESGDVEKAAVIRFAPGLRPNLDTRRGIIKHLQGKHDQSDHGRRGSGGTREALTARAEQLESEGRGAAAAVYRLRLHTDGPGGVRAFTRRESDSASLPVRDGQRQQVATLAVHELSPEARGILRAGGISTPVVHELDAENGGAEFFHAAISRSKEGNPYASSVFVYEPSEYRGMRLFVSEDGQSGIALKGDEIVSLFKTGTSGDREVSRPLLELGIQEGGRRGDCFDTVLPKIYAEHGLEVRHRVAWNDEYAPEGWDKRLYKKWNNGEPDVTFFRYNRDYTDEYRPGQGSLVDSYDDAVSLTQAAVLKHLKGQHDQKTHGGDGAAALPSGWTEYEAINVDEQQPDGTFVTHPRRTFGGPNQTVVTVTGTDIPASRVNQILTDVNTLQGIAPVENLKVDVGDGPFAQQGFSDTVYGFVPVGQSRIFLRPAARPFVDPGFNMPVLADDPGRYTLVHEYGHVLDRRSADKAAEDKSIVISSHQTGMSRYAFAEETVQPGREAFAEAFVGWVGSQGTFASEGPSGKAFVRYFANKYGWDSGGPGRPPSAGFAKQASNESNLLIADTFSAEGPKQVIARAPFAKHGDPSRPGYAQLHPTGAGTAYAEWGDHAGRIAEAERRGPDSEALSFMAAGEDYYDTEEEALEAFKEVYNYQHEGTNKNGEKVVLTAEVTGVMTYPGEGTFVEGRIKNEQGQQVGWFERTFRTDSDGAPVVEHGLLELRPGAQGTGFATEFNARAEDYYVSHGVDRITLHAALDKGGYAWASAGYEFDTSRSKLTYTRESLAARLKDADSFVPGIGNVEELSDLGRRLMLSPDSGEFPTPFEISRVGWTEGADTWAGKEILLGSDWYGVKFLRAEGRTAKAVAVQVLKHGDPSRPGYAQLHPSGAGSAYAEWGDHAGRIAAAEGRGPSEDVLRRAVESGSLVMPSEDEIAEWIQQNRPDDIDMTIDNNYNLYQRKEEIEGTEYERDWERDDALAELRREAAYLLASEEAPYYAEAMGRGPYYDEDEARAAFAEVYDYAHTGVNRDGDPVTIFASVDWVETLENEVTVVGDLKDDLGQQIGFFKRRFFKDDDGRLMVEHESLKMDPQFQGAGFATEFNARAEDYYVSHGIEAIRVHAGLDQGGYTWASAGFDFDPRSRELARSKANIADRIDDYLSVTSPDRAPVSPDQRKRLTSLRDRLESKDHTDPDFPTPFEIASFGRTSGAETWPGSEIMTGSNWYGEKPLTPAGRRRSATEAANKSAVIRLAAGLKPVLKHLRGKHDQSTHGGGASLAQSQAERDVDYLLRQGDAWLDEQLSRGRVVLPPPPGVLERVSQARRRVSDWIEERRNPPVEKLSQREVLELVRLNRARADAQREAQGLPPVDWPPYPDSTVIPVRRLEKASVDVMTVLGRVYEGVVDERLLRVIGLLGPLDRIGEPWAGLLGDMIEGALSGLPEDVFKHLKGQHDQQAHAGGGSGGKTLGGERLQEYMQEWHDESVALRRAEGRPDFPSSAWPPRDEAARAKGVVANRIAERLADIPVQDLVDAAYPAQDLFAVDDRREAMLALRDDPNRRVSLTATGRVRTMRLVDYEFGRQNGEELPEMVMPGSPEAQQLVRRAAVGTLVQQWAKTSNDEDAVSLAIQDAAAAEFGLADHAGWFRTEYLDRQVAELESSQPVYRRFLRAQYDETQAMFKVLGITSVRIQRGMGLPSETADAAFGVKGVEAGEPWQTVTQVQLRPLSAWSSDMPTAMDFARQNSGLVSGQVGVHLAADVPVSQILSTPYTGAGCLRESELVVIGSPTQATVSTIAAMEQEVAKHLKGQHDQSTHAGTGGGGYAAGGDEFQRDQESWFNKMLADRQGGDSPLLTEGQMRLPVDQRLKAAVAARLAERMSDVPAEKMAEAAFVGARPDYEHPHMWASREAMQPGSWVAIRDPLVYTDEVGGVGDLMVKPDDSPWAGRDGWVRSGTPEAAAKVRQAAASRMVQMWASSSNDDNIVSLAIQDAAAAEFGMEGHAPWPARDDVGRVARQRADAMTASHGDVYRSLVRAQYDETQAMFGDLGVASVRVYRGIRVEESAMSDAFQMYGTGFVGEARLRPLSSWSTRTSLAVSFAEGINDSDGRDRTGVVLSARLPVSQILSTPYTGVGCLGEDEVVSRTPTVQANINVLQMAAAGPDYGSEEVG